VPKLWNQTIETHRAAVHDAILDTTAVLVAENGLLSVTMSQIAEVTGIGRATLYKYFSDVEAILLAWQQRQITAHLEYLAEVRDRVSDVDERLKAVLEAYALLSQESHRHHDTELAAFMHRGDQLIQPQRQLHGMICDLVTEGADAGQLRDDVAADELASYCLHALTATTDTHTTARRPRRADASMLLVVKILVAPPGQAQRRHPGQVKRTDERG
jgi:AcrR family transcriptional regulator